MPQHLQCNSWRFSEAMPTASNWDTLFPATSRSRCGWLLSRGAAFLAAISSYLQQASASQREKQHGVTQTVRERRDAFPLLHMASFMKVASRCWQHEKSRGGSGHGVCEQRRHQHSTRRRAHRSASQTRHRRDAPPAAIDLLPAADRGVLEPLREAFALARSSAH